MSKQESRENQPITMRWTAARKKAAVLRLLSGEALDDVSRVIGVTIAQLEEWKLKVLDHMELSLKCREDDPLSRELDTAKRRIGELSMEIELLRERARKKGVFWSGR